MALVNIIKYEGDNTTFVKADGDQVVRDKGVRPAIWISLE